MQPTLLLADDSVTIQRVIQLTFADEDIQVVAVSDADEAIRMLDRTPPSIVLADIGMPGRNGYDIARHVKATPSLARIPVVLLTGAFEPLDQDKIAEVGCDGVLAKPFEPQAVVAKVRELLARASGDVDGYLDRLGGALTDLAAVRAPRPTEVELPSVDLVAARAAAMEAVAGVAKSPAQVTESPRAVQQTVNALPPLGDAFAALLAAEQTAPVPPRPAVWPGVPAATRPAPVDLPVSAVPEDFVAQVTRRVLDQMSDRIVRDTVTDIVTSVAERLVREEIDRIKTSIQGPG